MTKGPHFPKNAQSFLVKAVEDAKRSMKENNVVRNDILHALVGMEQHTRDGKRCELTCVANNFFTRSSSPS